MDRARTRPAVDQATTSVRGAMKESTISGKMTHGKVEYDPKTGVGKTAHSTDQVDIEIVITPKDPNDG